MIITECKSFDEILSLLSGKHKIFLCGCGGCATVCKTGGEEQIWEMEDFLTQKGKQILGYMIVDMVCHALLTKREIRKHEEMIKHSDAILCLACGTGAQVLRSCVDKEVICGVNSKFAGAVKRPNEFIRLCSLCGDCIINETDAICPIARCPKGMLNGPCGGVKDGKCEVFPELDCVWIEIYKKSPEKLKEIKMAKDFSKSQEVFHARYYSFERKT